MTLRIHNTLTRATERFTPIEPGHARLYVCGITIYDLCHMGHARFMLAFDVAQRWLDARLSGHLLRNPRHRSKIIRARSSAASRSAPHRRDIAALQQTPTHSASSGRPTSRVATSLAECSRVGTYSTAGLGTRTTATSLPGVSSRLRQLSGQWLDHARGRSLRRLDARTSARLVMWKSAKEGARLCSCRPFGLGARLHIECSAMCKRCSRALRHPWGAGQTVPHLKECPERRRERPRSSNV